MIGLSFLGCPNHVGCCRVPRACAGSRFPIAKRAFPTIFGAISQSANFEMLDQPFLTIRVSEPGFA
jgi:hypothetical protein